MDLECFTPEKIDCSGRLKIGSFAKAILRQNTRESLVIPISYLANQRTQLITVTEDQKAKFIDVKIGTFSGDKVEIVEGVEAGTKIISHYARFPTEGSPVTVTTQEAERLKLTKKEAASDAKDVVQ